MKLNNTNHSKRIMKRNISVPQLIVGGVVIFSLATILVTSDINKPVILDTEEKGYYDTQYLEALHNINASEYDEQFDNAYRNVSYSYNGEKINGSAIYIVRCEDNTVHLVNANNSKYDLLTKTMITSKVTNIVVLKESSAFYVMYGSGLIQDNVLVIGDNLFQYVNAWDGLKHNKTADLIAESQASEAYQKKYGGRHNG